MKTMKIWEIAFNLWPSRLKLGKVMRASLSFCLIAASTTLAALSLTSCSLDDDDSNPDNWICTLPPDWGMPAFTLDADSIPHFRNASPMTKAEFDSFVAGKGWHCIGLQEIYNDGTFSNESLELIGIGAPHYYFGSNSLTKFIYVDYLGYINGGLMHADRPYTYDEKTGTILIDNTTELQLFGYLRDAESRNFLYAIWQVGVKSNGVPIYSVMTLQQMTNKELEETRQQYATDFDEIEIPTKFRLSVKK